VIWCVVWVHSRVIWCVVWVHSRVIWCVVWVHSRVIWCVVWVHSRVIWCVVWVHSRVIWCVVWVQRGERGGRADRAAAPGFQTGLQVSEGSPRGVRIVVQCYGQTKPVS
jgi:hypothetical protein